MARGSIAVKGTIASTVAAAAIMLSAPAALANTVNHGAFSCGPDMQVVISWSLSRSATSTLTWYYFNSNGQLIKNVLPSPAGRNFTVNTAQRSVAKWTVSSSATVTFTGGSCL